MFFRQVEHNNLGTCCVKPFLQTGQTGQLAIVEGEERGEGYPSTGKSPTRHNIVVIQVIPQQIEYANMVHM